MEVAAEKDALTEFADWWMETRPLLIPFSRALMWEDNVGGSICGSVLYRQPPWQVQMFILTPNTTVPQHRHPNVDSFEVYLSGEIEFSIDGEILTPFKDGSEPDFMGAHKFFGKTVRVSPSSWHGAQTGAKGGAFLSIQKWMNDVAPTNVGDDWVEKEVA